MNRCFSCFKEYSEEYDICPHCGIAKITEPVEAIHLYPGTVLCGRYVLGQAVGSGGFGTIYKAWDSKLDTIIAIKEFFVSRLMTRAAGTKEVIVNKKAEQEYLYRKHRFLEEARNMAKFGAHRSIPNVFEFFEENGTAYIVMELLEGVALNDYLKQNGGKLDRDFALLITNEVGQALISMHDKGIVHRDVAPDNIFICAGKDIKIKLLDLGAAKLSDKQEEVIDIVLKPGYSPVEQYDNTSKVGPWTDVYALGASLYVMLTGVKPEESTNRKIEDEVKSPYEIDASIPVNLSNCIMKAMAVEKHMRFKNVSEFLKTLNSQKKVLSQAKEKKRRKRRRISGILVAGLLVALGAGLVYNAYAMKQAEQQLPEATISIWYCAAPDADEVLAMESIKADFESKFEDVTIELRRFDEDVYLSELSIAAANDQLPALFESTDATDDILSQASDISAVLQTEQASSCMFLQGYSNDKKVPLAFEIPVAFVVTNGPSKVDYEEVYFNDLNTFSNVTEIAVDESEKDFVVMCMGDEVSTYDLEMSDFPGADGNCAVLLSSSTNMNDIKKDILSGYTWHCSFYNGENAKGCFDYEWSMGNVDENQRLVAEKLLSWMLGNVYQNTLMISRAQDGQLPLNGTCFTEKCETNTELKPLLSIKDEIVIQE